jgi:hypothetical protein
MEAALPDSGGTDTSGLPWERPVREITLAARSDVIEEMRDPWSKYLSAINACARQFSAIWTEYLEKSWNGDAARACYVEWQKIYVEITNFAKNYSGVDGSLKNAEKAVIEARETIPIPVFNGDRLPGDTDSETGSATDLKITGDDLYSNYQKDSPSYADYAFRARAERELSQGETPVGVREHTKSGYGVNGAVEAYEQPALTSKEKQAREQAIQEWYHTHQSMANVARDNLLTDYAHSKSSLPKSYGGFINKDDHDDGKKKDPGSHHLPGGGDGSGVAYGAGAFGATGGAGLGAGAVHASLPTARHTSTPSPPSSITDGIRLAGDPDPASAGPVGGTGLSGSGSSSRLPLSWSNAPAGGAGSFGAVGAGGAGGGFGGVGLPGTSAPVDGWWNRPRTGSVGPAANSPAAQLAAARGGASTTGSTSGVGMMPHGGGSGGKQRDERQTWLTEDDEDIFRAKPATPGLIE